MLMHYPHPRVSLVMRSALRCGYPFCIKQVWYGTSKVYGSGRSSHDDGGGGGGGP